MTALPPLSPPSATGSRRPGAPAARYGWVFLRLSGLLLPVLALGQVLSFGVLDGGVARLSSAYLAGRWSSPFWQLWDLALLWLGLPHGALGVQVVLRDRVRSGRTRFWLAALGWTVTGLALALGTLTVLTWDPNR